MKLSIEQVRKMAYLQKQVAEVYNTYDLSSFSEKGVLTTANTFFDTFETFSVKSRRRADYPYEVSAVAGDVLFYTIITAAEVVELENTHPDKFEYISKAIQEESS